MPKTINLRSIDLNLLPILRELLRTRNVTRAAETLHMTQSAVSEALRRIRHQFDDEILVRVGRTMVPTQFAESLALSIEAALEKLEELIAPPTFDPRQLERQFVIATGDNVMLTLGSNLLSRLVIEAPGVRVQFLDLQQLGVRALENGKIDLLILPKGLLPDQGLHSCVVYHEEYVCIARKNHPLLSRRPTQRQIERATRIAYRADQHSKIVGSLLVDDGSTDRMHLPVFTLLPFLVETTDAIALIQRNVAEKFKDFLNIQILPLPANFPTSDVCAFWGNVHENDPAHRWFRNLILEIAQAATQTGR